MYLKFSFRDKTSQPNGEKCHMIQPRKLRGYRNFSKLIRSISRHTGSAAHGNVSKAPINLRDDSVYSCLNSSYNVFCSLARDYENMGFRVSLQENKSHRI
jgi:hypothetical protein